MLTTQELLALPENTVFYTPTIDEEHEITGIETFTVTRMRTPGVLTVAQTIEVSSNVSVANTYSFHGDVLDSRFLVTSQHFAEVLDFVESYEDGEV